MSYFLSQKKGRLNFYFFIFNVYSKYAEELSLVIITKVAIEKIQFSVLATVFSVLPSIDSLLYSLLAFKYYFV
jgi:hypothetical protein